MKQLLSILLVGAQLYGAASSSSNQIQWAADEQQTLPFAMLIDDEETPDSENYVIVSGFDILLQEEYAFLVSDSVVYNYLVRNQRKDPIKGDVRCCSSSLDRTKWDIYKVLGTQFVLFVPKSGLHDYREAFNAPSPALELIPSAEDLLARITLSKSSMKKVEPSDLRAVFKTKKSVVSSGYTAPKWNIIIHGHGSLRPRKIADMSMADRTVLNMLKFFNDELDMSALYLETCSTGGFNRAYLEFDAGKQMPIDLKYKLIIGSVDDNVTWFDGTTREKWAHFFRTASNQLDSLNVLLAGLFRAERHAGSPHASDNIPQVKIPGVHRFQTYKVDKEVKILSNAMVHAHEDEDRPIDIPRGTKAVLIYPEYIRVPVRVEFDQQGVVFDQSITHNHNDVTARANMRALKGRAWEQYPSALEMVMSNFDQVFAAFDPVQYPEFNKYKASVLALDGRHEALGYPKFIPMVWPEVLQRNFTRIELPYTNANFPVGGVMHFIRDAFIEALKNRKSKRTRIYIDELEGENDLLILLELTRRLNRARVKNYLPDNDQFEQELRSYSDKRITLSKILVDMVSQFISFEFAGIRRVFSIGEREGDGWLFIAIFLTGRMKFKFRRSPKA